MNNIIQTRPDGQARNAQDIFAEMMSAYGFGSDMSGATKQDRDFFNTARRTYDLCCKFLADNRILNAGLDATNFSTDLKGLESFNTNFNPATMSTRDIDTLVDSVGVPKNLHDEAAAAVMSLLAKIAACKNDSNLFRLQHFTHGDNKNINNVDKSNTVVYAPSLRSMLNNIGLPGQESFGANIDKVLPDIRASMAVTLLQFHRGLLDRIIHRRTSASPYVKYVVPYAEVYDMLKSNDPDHRVRNEGDHIVPFIELYGDPRVVSNTLQPIVPLTSNDTNDDLLADGYIKFNHSVNIFDLSVIPNQLGKTHYNYTDLVSENVILNSIVIKLKKNMTEETFEVDVHNVNGARFNMMPNVNDSGIRSCMLDYTVRLNKNSKTMTGEPSTLLASCTDTDYLRVNLLVAAQINLKYSDTQALGTVTVEAYNSAHTTVASAVTELVKNLTVSLEGYSLDACYSEENLRKSNLAIRYNVRTFDFEISNGRNILIDYSFQEELPDFLMSLVTEATSLGQDHRGIDVIVKQMMYVYDTTNLENADPDFRERLDKIGFQYVASQLVRPVVYLNTIDLDNVDTIRSSDVLGDIRQYVEWQLLNLVSLYFQNSFYTTQLKPGAKPTFKVFTSSVIKDNLLSIPHIHNHLNVETPADGTNVEYRRVLPNGAILDIVTTSFNYLRDKIVMIPWIEDDPESVLNWGHNWDFGTFVANYNPQLDNSVNKRIFSNARTMVTPTNPAGLYLDVKNISKLINMFAVTNPVINGSSVPQPSDVIEATE